MKRHAKPNTSCHKWKNTTTQCKICEQRFKFYIKLKNQTKKRIQKLF